MMTQFQTIRPPPRPAAPRPAVRSPGPPLPTPCPAGSSCCRRRDWPGCSAAGSLRGRGPRKRRHAARDPERQGSQGRQRTAHAAPARPGEDHHEALATRQGAAEAADGEPSPCAGAAQGHRRRGARVGAFHRPALNTPPRAALPSRRAPVRLARMRAMRIRGGWGSPPHRRPTTSPSREGDDQRQQRAAALHARRRAFRRGSLPCSLKPPPAVGCLWRVRGAFAEQLATVSDIL